jgi:hypothetical protein
VHGRRCRVGQDCAGRCRGLGQDPGEGGLGQAGGFDWRWVGRELERGEEAADDGWIGEGRHALSSLPL